MLQWLQGSAQNLFLRTLHASRHQAEPSVVFGQHFNQQAGLAPGARVQDEGGFFFYAHLQRIVGLACPTAPHANQG
jgi:hypothetical protein